MSVYGLIFWDSFKGTSIFSLSLETLWFSAKEFGSYNLFIISALSFAGAVLAMCATYWLGRLAGPVVKSMFMMDEEVYQKVSFYSNKYGIFILLLQMMPVVKLLFLFAGFLNIPFRRVLIFMVAGRLIYFIYYLYLLPNLPSYYTMFG